jgi:hypothetical protein
MLDPQWKRIAEKFEGQWELETWLGGPLGGRLRGVKRAAWAPDEEEERAIVIASNRGTQSSF